MLSIRSPHVVGIQHSLRPSSLQQSSRPFSRTLTQSTTPAKDHPKPLTTTKSPSSSPKQNHSVHPFNVYREIQKAGPAVRYTVYAGFGLLVTVESTFWFTVLKAKFFPKDSEEAARAEEKLRAVWDAARGYRLVYIRNYGRYYLAYMWGLSYGGLNGLVSDEDNDVGR